MVRAAARPDEIRRHNLGLLLEQVHRDGELTRAELTHRLGLNRSTIGALVADLIDLGVLNELVPTSADRAGRPSHMVGPRADGPYAVAVDIEVDRIASAAVGIGGRVLTRHSSTLSADERDPKHVSDIVAQHARRLLADVGGGGWPVGVGISVPGTVSRGGALVGNSPNLEWRDLLFADLVADRLDVPMPVELGNDADLGVLAEHLRGAARGSNDVVYIAGRIGVGAGVLVDGLPLRGFRGLAGEIGHVVLDPKGPMCHCGNRGCVETYIGESALLRSLGRPDKPSSESIGRLFEAVAAGDAPAINALHGLAEPLGRTIATLANLLDPELVVLGGALAHVLAVARPEVEGSLHRHAFGDAPESIRLVGAGLGTDSSLIGAAELAFGRLLADPFSRP